MSIQELSKILMYEFCFVYLQPKYSEKSKLSYMDTERFIIYIKTDDICKDIGENVETRFDTSNYESQRPLPKRKNKKVLRLMKDYFGRKSRWNLFD